MKVISINVSTKKNEVQRLRWLVVQDVPYPTIKDGRWENHGGLFPAYGSKATGIGKNYICYLLSDTCPEAVPENYDRTVFAGFVKYQSNEFPAGGTMKFRGRDLGEMRISFMGKQWDYPDIRVNGHDRPSNSERDAIKSLVVPYLRAFIEQHASELQQGAVEKIKARMTQEVAEARDAINRLEKQAETATFQ